MNELVLTFLAGGGALAATTWFAREVTKKWLDQLAERDAQRMKLDHARELEAFKSQLQIAAHEAQSRSAALVTRQSEVIADLYKRLVVAENALHGMIRPVRFSSEAKPRDMAPEASERLNSFVRYYVENKIFLSPEVAKEVGCLVDLYRKAELSFGLWGIEGEPDDGLQHERFESQQQAWDVIHAQAPKARTTLEAQFRELLAVTKAKP